MYFCIRHVFHRNPSKEEIEQAFDRFYPHTAGLDVNLAIKRIQEILKENHRHLLHIFSLDRDKNVAETIFKAIFAGRIFEQNFSLINFLFIAKNKKKKMDNEKNEGESLEQEKQRRQDEDKLVDLALEWNYFDGVLPILQARQGEMAKRKHDFTKVKSRR
jgi:hypothetical protein